MTTPNYRCSFDGVSEGADITVSSTATGSGTAINAGSTAKADALAAAAIRGGKGARISQLSGTDCWLYWTFTAASTVAVQVYFKIDSGNPPSGGASDFIQIRNGSARVVSGRLTTGNVVQVVDAGSTVRMTTTTAPADGWYVLTICATKGTSTSDGRIAAWLRKASDDSTVVTPIDASTYNTGTADFTTVRFGKTSGTGDLTLDMDEPAVAWGTFGEIDRVPLAPAPGAHAGEPQTVEPWVTVTLNGSESEGAIDTWTWTQTVGPSVGALTNPNTAAPSFTAPAVVDGTALTFTLSTSAASVPSGGTDSVTVTVLAPTELMDDGAGTLVPVRVRMES